VVFVITVQSNIFSKRIMFIPVDMIIPSANIRNYIQCQQKYPTEPYNTNGLGDGANTMIQYPIPVGTTGALEGKIVVDFDMQANTAIVLAWKSIYMEEILMEFWEMVQQAIESIQYQLL
jgi:hypothetical protein